MRKRALIMLVLCLSFLYGKAQQKTGGPTGAALGKAIYLQYCLTCHQADATGAQNMIPPLVKTSQVLGPKPALINILLNGMSGEIKVNGDIYAGEMPSQAHLKDEEIAAVLTYIRNDFGNKASAVTVSEVKKARSANKK